MTRRTFISRFRTLPAVVSAVVFSLVLVSCSVASPMPSPAPSGTSAVVPSGNGVLRIGVLGKPVEVLARDSGDVTTATIEASIADLVTAQADVLVGS
ncbi:MAG: hypothetical protein H7279_02280 [Microbacteriaceae bacterium]|nr:hypothetical protein [Microbacteriaceae bacterium]